MLGRHPGGPGLLRVGYEINLGMLNAAVTGANPGAFHFADVMHA